MDDCFCYYEKLPKFVPLNFMYDYIYKDWYSSLEYYDKKQLRNLLDSLHVTFYKEFGND